MSTRIFLYFFCLSVLALAPLILFYELFNNFLWFTGPMVRTVISTKDIITSDVAFLGELTPAVAATFVAALAPRPMTKLTSLVSLTVCGISYILYLLLTAHLDGHAIIFERTLLNSVELAIEGHVPPAEFDDSISLVKSMTESVRIFYLVAAGSIVGFMFNSNGLTNEHV